MRLLHIIILITFLSGFYMQSSATISFKLMKGFPQDEPGIEKGVSACYAGHIGSTLVMAGGCNFPDKPVAEGGRRSITKASMLPGSTKATRSVGRRSEHCRQKQPMG